MPDKIYYIMFSFRSLKLIGLKLFSLISQGKAWINAEGYMNKIIEKILIVLIFGSLWGAFELYGADMLVAIGVPHKSPFLFSFGLLVLVMSKKLSDFPMSAVLIAFVALFYKSFAPNFHVCWATQTAAITINGLVFELGYRLMRNRFDSHIAWRSAGAVIIALGSYTALMSFNAAFRPEVYSACGGIQGFFSYISTSGLYAAALSILTINIGYWLGMKIHTTLNNPQPGFIPTATKAFGIVVLVATWAAQIIY